MTLYSYNNIKTGVEVAKDIKNTGFKKTFKKSVFRNYSRNNYQKLKISDLPSVQRGIYKVAIDPGHGGPDPGAIGLNGLRETDVVLDVSLQVSQFLSAKGVKVLLTRKNEIDLDLPPRVRKANNFKANAIFNTILDSITL